MNNVLSAVFLSVMPVICNAGTLFCDIIPTKVQLGQIGDLEVFTYVCSDDKCYNLGKFSEEKTKQFYAMSLAAVSAGNKMRVTYFASSADSCSDIPSTENVFAAIYSK